VGWTGARRPAAACWAPRGHAGAGARRPRWDGLQAELAHHALAAGLEEEAFELSLAAGHIGWLPPRSVRLYGVNEALAEEARELARSLSFTPMLRN
jgi:hypothetical protein